MSRRRVIAAVVAGGLAMLALAWQGHRERQIARCHEADGIWNGPSSTCTNIGGRPLLRREGLGRI